MMSTILELEEQLRNTTALIAKLERALAGDPTSHALALSLRSLERRREVLETRFAELADSLGMEICRYRLFGGAEAPAVRVIGEAVVRFQQAMSVIYDAVRRGRPRDSGPLSGDTIYQSTFNLGYTYSGSVGIVLTIPNERRLFGESHLDEAMQKFIALSRARDPSQLAELAKTIGLGPIRAIYAWSETHAEAGLGAEIEWLRDQTVRASLMVQSPELRRLHQIIDAASDQEADQFTAVGQLLGADVGRHSFHMVIGEENIIGDFVDAISIENTVELPKTYRATIRRTTTTKYSTEQVVKTHRLLRLEPV